jgi:hypothetical protein
MPTFPRGGYSIRCAYWDLSLKRFTRLHRRTQWSRVTDACRSRNASALRAAC